LSKEEVELEVAKAKEGIVCLSQNLEIKMTKIFLTLFIIYYLQNYLKYFGNKSSAL
jgi:hypothetical protein